MKKRGRPVLGAIAGFFLGVFVSLDLFVLGVLPLESDVLGVIPVAGLIAGIAAGLTAPLRRRAEKVHITPLPNLDPHGGAA